MGQLGRVDQIHKNRRKEGKIPRQLEFELHVIVEGRERSSNEPKHTKKRILNALSDYLACCIPHPVHIGYGLGVFTVS